MKIIVLYGLAQQPEHFAQMLRHLPQFECLVPKLHENSRRPPDFAALLAEYRAYLDTVDGDFILFGLSLGAIAALGLALEQPHPRLKGLSLAGGHYKLKGDVFYRVQSAAFHLMPAALFAKAGLDKGNLLPFFRSLRHIDYSRDLPQLNMPVQLLAGSRDFSNRRPTRRMAGLLPDAELHILPGCGHLPNQDCPQKLAALVGRFAARVAAESKEKDASAQTGQNNAV